MKKKFSYPPKRKEVKDFLRKISKLSLEKKYRKQTMVIKYNGDYRVVEYDTRTDRLYHFPKWKKLTTAQFRVGKMRIS